MSMILLRSLLPLALLASMSLLSESLIYPTTPQSTVVDNYHGTQVPDPYRWLEDDTSEATKAWVVAQNAVTSGYLSQLPQRLPIRDRMTKLFNFERFGTPFRAGGRYFFSRNNGLQNQSVWYWAASLEAQPVLLIDPNTFSADGTVSMSVPVPSEDGRTVAYQVSKSGSDWQEIRVHDVGTGKQLSDRIQWVKFSGIAWAKDGSGFY